MGIRNYRDIDQYLLKGLTNAYRFSPPPIRVLL